MSNKLGRILLIVLIKLLCFCGEDNVDAMECDDPRYYSYYYGDYAADQPDNINNEDENYIILIGTVKIGKEKDGELSYRNAKENEMLTQKLYSLAQNTLDAKNSSIKKIYAKFETNNCLRFSKKLKTKEEFMNEFKVSFDQKTIYINKAEEKAEIKSNKYFNEELTYSISREYFAAKSSSEEASSSAASSTKQKLKQLGKIVKSLPLLGGKDNDKKKYEQYKKKPHVFDIYKKDSRG